MTVRSSPAESSRRSADTSESAIHRVRPSAAAANPDGCASHACFQVLVGVYREQGVGAVGPLPLRTRPGSWATAARLGSLLVSWWVPSQP